MDIANTIFPDKLVEDIVLSLQHPAQIKDAKTGQYILSNKPHLDALGMCSVKEIIGLKLNDLEQLMGDKWGGYAKYIEKMESQVLNTKETVKAYDQAWIKSNGLIWVHNAIKIPVTSASNQLLAILTITEDVTLGKSPIYLYNLYKKLYIHKKIGVERFLEHMGIRNYFFELPSDAEIKVLLTRNMTNSNKETANKLFISLKTVEAHIYHIKQKTSNLEHVFSRIRNFNEQEL